MKEIVRILTVSVMTFFLFFNCGGSKKTLEVQLEPGYEEVGNPFADLQALADNINQSGGIAMLGTGTSGRRNIAQDKARKDAQRKLAETIGTKVQSLGKTFIEEVGESERSEMNTAYSSTVKLVTNQVLQGAMETKSKHLKKTSGDTYEVGIIMSITPEVFNNSLLNSMKSNHLQLYERFRASEAYKELEKEMEKYNANYQNN